jgi:hypothetical protein
VLRAARSGPEHRASEWPCLEGASLVTLNNRNERNSHRRATVLSDGRTGADQRPGTATAGRSGARVGTAFVVHQQTAPTFPDLCRTTWTADLPVLVVAEGLTCYLRAADGVAMLRHIAEHFGSGEMVFDGYSRLGCGSHSVMGR